MAIGRFLLLAVLACPAAVVAQVGVQGLIWRGGDPFVFCRYGLDQDPKAWVPTPNYATSIPMVTPGYCSMPTPYCQYQTGWSLTEIQSYYVYLRICPQARDSGRWDGSGDGTHLPTRH